VEIAVAARVEGPIGVEVGAFDAKAAAEHARAYDDSYGPLFLSFRRNEAWWKDAERRCDLQVGPGALRSLRAGASTIGHLVARAGRLLELSALDGHREAALAAAVRHVDGERLVSTLPLGHWATRELRRMEHTMTVRFSWDGGHMVRALDRGLLELIDPERWRASDLRDHAAARLALLDVAGVGEAPRPLWPDPPSWSPIDEV
jgi:hypothetical protein